MRDRLEPIWPSNKKLSRLKLKTERVELTPEGLANSLPAHDAQCFRSETVSAPAERELTRNFESNKDYRETGRRIRLTSSPRLQSYFLCKKEGTQLIVVSLTRTFTLYYFSSHSSECKAGVWTLTGLRL